MPYVLLLLNFTSNNFELSSFFIKKKNSNTNVESKILLMPNLFFFW